MASFLNFTEMVNVTNETWQGQLQVITQSSGVDPTLLFFAPSILLLIVYALMWYFAESRSDLGITFFLLPVAALMFGDAFLMTVKLEIGAQSLNLPTILFTAAIYEMAIMFAMMDQARREQKKSKGGDE